MARTKDEQLHEQRRTQILQAAAEIFRAKGFHAARTEEICAAAGLSSGTVFRYFRNKEEIIAAIAEMEIDDYRRHITLLATKAGLLWLAHLTPEGLAELLAPSTFELGTDSWLELCRHPDYRQRLLACDTELRGLLAGALATGQAEGWVRAELHAAGTANLVLALFSGLLFESETRIPTDLGATAQALADLFQHHVLKGVSRRGKPAPLKWARAS